MIVPVFQRRKGWLLVWLLTYTLLAQAQPQTHPTPFRCGAENLTLPQKIELERQMAIALQNRDKSFTGIVYVPIRPHIIRRSDGTGGFSIADLNAVMAGANSQFMHNGTGIQFYFCGSTPNYIDNDSYYNTNDLSFLYTVTHDARNALNQYYVQQLGEGIDGFASIPLDNITSTRSVIRVSSSSLNYIGKQLIAHELGHTFNLYHTFTSYSGTTPYTDELVTRGPGANCDVAGDLVCDTPADPYNVPGARMLYVNGCPTYDPTSTARDPNGDPYTPSITNIMSYYFPCTPEFTPGQYERIQGGLAIRQSHTDYTLDCPPTNVTPPSNLIAYTSPTTVVLNWQDNATNEMGYFIERSTSPESGFVPVGGVGPNSLAFTDVNVTANTQYYYRIRPSNTAAGHLSPTVAAFTSACHPTFQNGCAANDGIAGLTINGVVLSQQSGCSAGGYGQFNSTNSTLTAGQSVAFSVNLLSLERAEGVTIWADLNHNQAFDLGENLFVSPTPTTGSVSGTLLIPETTLPGLLTLRVIAAHNTIPFYPCDPYEAGETEDYQITIIGAPVSGLTTTNISANSAQLNWASLGPGVTYDIQWRAVGSPTWNSITNYGVTTYTLYGLVVNTDYEWRIVRAGTTDYSETVHFTTPCPTPIVYSANPLRTSAQLYWGGQSGQTYTLHWRLAGTANWNTVSSLTTSSYSLTGLTANTAYEWSVQAICSGTISTPFTDPASFTTTPCMPPSLAASVDVGSTSVRFIWSDDYPEPNKTYLIRYRPIGSSTWATISGITTRNYTLTGLAGNTPYEWQLQSTCSATESSDYTSTKSFTTVCAIPIGLFSAPSASGAGLIWYISYSQPGTTYDLQYRQTGTPEWTMVNSLTSGSYSITGLASSTSYEWRVRTNCPGNYQSDYSAIETFTTVCNAPNTFGLLVSYVTSTSAQLSWYQPTVDANTRYDLRWRAVGSTEWTLVSGLSTNSSIQGLYSLTGLTNNTTYEWQIRTACSPTESSSFTPGPAFTTRCSIPIISYYTAQVTVAYISWNQAGLGVTYEIRYRPLGTSDWTVVSSLTGTTASLTGLTGNTSYEWQIRTRCTDNVFSDYSDIRQFQTVPCNPPFVGSTTAITASSAVLQWFYPFGVVNYDIRWRAIGATDWILISNINGINPGNQSVALTNLNSNTSYEWQIRTLCSATESSAFSNSFTFQTLPPCLSMYTVKTGFWNDPSVWSCNRIPTGTDEVQIKHIITVPANYVGNALTVRYDTSQKLIFGTNARLRLGL